MIKAVIIEDEFNALNTLDKLIKYTQKDIEVIAKIDNVADAILFLKEQTPDLVFLDIELIGGNAFQILEALDSIAFKIIFTTAYDEFAIKAIKFDTIDYLLKPIDSEELTQCINRFRVAFKKEQVYKNAIDKVSEINEKEIQKTLLIKTADAQYFLQIKDIVRCQSDGAYTIFHTADKKIMSARNLKYYENILSEHTFVRVHQSHLVNIKYIKTITTNNIVCLTNDEKIPVATRKKSYLKQLLDSL
ncbi:response regulator transcription factor [Cellulophaga sp. E16_2]|uniref:Two component transcriptional regulator, LytTR family n=1 Tax=Cellulophaga algicola (strain DSM 14237 / IC166 / ACAM 630) TaxID=688270 RepID=E6X5D8_CELAD|nr:MULTISPECIES: LytTR family DNA-binding domain-containing protein [Cellulophaga]ADV50493.1 two component transcriptional regulator, LytTR family [Cellulophaga algicola DSM 14237]MBO0592902.1 response regulator transcription factor [Cellulophaga sp. E16_2]